MTLFDPFGPLMGWGGGGGEGGRGGGCCDKEPDDGTYATGQGTGQQKAFSDSPDSRVLWLALDNWNKYLIGSFLGISSRLCDCLDLKS